MPTVHCRYNFSIHLYFDLQQLAYIISLSWKIRLSILPLCGSTRTKMGKIRDFFRSDFSTFWRGAPKCTKIWSEKVPDFLPFWDNLTHLGGKLASQSGGIARWVVWQWYDGGIAGDRARPAASREPAALSYWVVSLDHKWIKLYHNGENPGLF